MSSVFVILFLFSSPFSDFYSQNFGFRVHFNGFQFQILVLMLIFWLIRSKFVKIWLDNVKNLVFKSFLVFKRVKNCPNFGLKVKIYQNSVHFWLIKGQDFRY